MKYQPANKKLVASATIYNVGAYIANNLVVDATTLIRQSGG